MSGIALLLVLCAAAACQPPTSVFDLVIVNGEVVDGSGTPAFSADIAIHQDTIVRIGQITDAERALAGQVIDARGLIVAPGFIDIHSHSDFTLLVDGTAQSKIRQGVTTEILGESGSAGPIQGQAAAGRPFGLEIDWTTLGGYFDRLEDGGISVNVGSYVGATQVRLCVLGNESRDPTPDEMEKMTQLVDQAMQDGALGLSTSLLVPPNTYHTTRQLAAMAAVVKPYGGIYSTHIRSEGEDILEAIQEAIQIGEQAGVPVDIIHLKIADRRLWGGMEKVRDLINQARERGLQVTANQYPYIAGQNNLDALIPPWAMQGGRGEMLKRLGAPADRARMEKDILEGVPDWFDHYLAMGGWEGCQVASVRTSPNKPFEGKSIAWIAEELNKKPTDVVFDLLLEEGGSVPAIYFLMSEDDVRYAMQIPWVSFGSDGTAVRPDGVLGEGKPHPRWYGTFPRILGKYVRQEGVLAVEEAVRKMTSLNASKLGISDRGTLKEGMKADITLFDPQSVIDKATFQDPHQYPEGIEHVIVNGVPVLEKGRHLGARPGKIVRGKQAE